MSPPPRAPWSLASSSSRVVVGAALALVLCCVLVERADAKPYYNLLRHLDAILSNKPEMAPQRVAKGGGDRGLAEYGDDWLRFGRESPVAVPAAAAAAAAAGHAGAAVAPPPHHAAGANKRADENEYRMWGAKKRGGDDFDDYGGLRFGRSVEE